MNTPHEHSLTGRRRFVVRTSEQSIGGYVIVLQVEVLLYERGIAHAMRAWRDARLEDVSAYWPEPGPIEVMHV